MEMQGEARIPAPKQVVWEALNDPEALKASITGCEELTRDGDNQFSARVRAKVGPVSARFAGTVTLSDVDAPNGYRISGEGKGGAAGFAKGGAIVRLEEDGPDATLLKYDVTASVGGKLAQIGARLVDGAAKKMADEFFAKFAGVAAERAGKPPPDTGAVHVATTDVDGPSPDLGAGAQPTPQQTQQAQARGPSQPPPEPPARDPAAQPPPGAPGARATPSEAAQPAESAPSAVRATLDQDRAAQGARPTPPPQGGRGGGLPILMWVAIVGLAVAALLFVLLY